MTRIECPSEAWDRHCEQNESPEDLCAYCGAEIGDKDPGCKECNGTGTIK